MDFYIVDAVATILKVLLESGNNGAKINLNKVGIIKGT